MTMVNLKSVTEGKWNVEEAVELLNSGKIDTNITIQRSEKWKQGQREALIDSMLEGLPRIPQIQLNRVANTDVHEALDGKQRLTTLRDILGDVFVVERDEPFNFKGKKYDLKGKRFSEFPQEIKQQIALYPLNFWNTIRFRQRLKYLKVPVDLFYWLLLYGLKQQFAFLLLLSIPCRVHRILYKGYALPQPVY